MTDVNKVCLIQICGHSTYWIMIAQMYPIMRTRMKTRSESNMTEKININIYTDTAVKSKHFYFAEVTAELLN